VHIVSLTLVYLGQVAVRMNLLETKKGGRTIWEPRVKRPERSSHSVIQSDTLLQVTVVFRVATMIMAVLCHVAWRRVDWQMFIKLSG
jgi:hypothetical protein